MWDELVNFFDLTVTKEDIKRYANVNQKQKKKPLFCGAWESD